MAGNPHAAMVRIEPRKAGAYEGQRRHDMRRGALPAYVAADRVALNEVVREPPPAGRLRAINEARRERRGLRRAMRSDTAPAWVGVLGLGGEAQRVVAAMKPEQQRAGFEAAAAAVAETLGTTVEGLVIHRDESAIHAHLTLAAYDRDGRPLTATVKRNTLSRLQDAVADAWRQHAPGIMRGTPVEARREAGDDYADTVHRSVRELRNALPADIAARRAELAGAERRVAEMSARVADLEQRIGLNEAEAKRLTIYRRRLAERVEAEKAAREEAARVGAVEVAAIKADAEQHRDALKRACGSLRALARRAGLIGKAGPVGPVGAELVRMTDAAERLAAAPPPAPPAPAAPALPIRPPLPLAPEEDDAAPRTPWD